MKLRFIITIMTLLLMVNIAYATDNFRAIKLRMAAAPALHFYFQSIVESTVFESVDSLTGQAMICKAGSYRLEIGDDVFIFDRGFFYSYSLDNNQLVIDKPADAAGVGDQITFLTKLDSYYESFTLLSDEKYRLIRLETAPTSLPDSLILHINGTHIDEISYFDINEDLNRISVDSVVYLKQCDSLALEPDFPDSTETLKLY